MNNEAKIDAFQSEKKRIVEALLSAIPPDSTEIDRELIGALIATGFHSGVKFGTALATDEFLGRERESIITEVVDLFAQKAGETS